MILAGWLWWGGGMDWLLTGMVFALAVLWVRTSHLSGRVRELEKKRRDY